MASIRISALSSGVIATLTRSQRPLQAHLAAQLHFQGVQRGSSQLQHFSTKSHSFNCRAVPTLTSTSTSPHSLDRVARILFRRGFATRNNTPTKSTNSLGRIGINSVPKSTRHELNRNYSTGQQSYDRTISILTWGIIGLNVIIFIGWQIGIARFRNDKDARLLEEMADKFTLRLDSEWQMTSLASCFSHKSVGHLVFNMFALHAFISILGLFRGVRGGDILALCICSGLAGSFAWLGQQKLKADAASNPRERAQLRHRSALGASGMAMGVGAAATCLLPRAPMQLFFIPINIPLWVLTGLYFAYDTFSLSRDGSMVGHAAHLGGAVFGFAYYALVLRRFGIAGLSVMRPR